ncbi:hypothetical protein HYW21_04160 [Candidatus Woesearchaeota archaeon]|nr:hypothetical protein [Candidatus Woesearchaeota archaeon]
MGWWGYQKRAKRHFLPTFLLASGVALFFFFLTSSSYAQQDQNLTFIFSLPDLEDISPPANPENSRFDQQKFPSSGSGQLFYSLRLVLLDPETEQPLEKAHVYLELVHLQTGETVKTLKYVRNHEPLLLSLAEGNWQIMVKINTPESTGNDYYRNFTLLLNTTRKELNETVYLNPVGSIRGIVVDNQGNIVVGAIIQFFCSSSLGDISEQISDEYGSFSALWLPEGSCKIAATDREAVGYTTSIVTQGQMNDVEIILNKEVQGKLRSSVVFLLAGPLLFFLLFILLVVMRKKKTNKVSTTNETEQEQGGDRSSVPQTTGASQEIKQSTSQHNDRINDILATLNPKEKEVVSYLLNQNPSTQARIRYAIRIPKTTLARVFLSLEAKNIITVEALGKMKNIALTQWFLGKSSK